MDIFKIIFLCCLIIISCSKKENSKIDELQNNYNDLHSRFKAKEKELETFREQHFNQLNSLHTAVKQINEINLLTNNARLRIDRNEIGINEINKIHDYLNDLKEYVIKNFNKYAEYNKIINELNDFINQQTVTINNLKKEIKEKEKIIINKNVIIQDKENHISKQQSIINQQNKSLIEQQRNLIYKMGHELFIASRQLPKVSGKKDKNNIKNTKYYILIKSKECIQQAHNLGHIQASELLKQINRELAQL